MKDHRGETYLKSFHSSAQLKKQIKNVDLVRKKYTKNINN